MALVEASAPTLHLGTACYYGGWASLKQCGKIRKRCFLFTLSCQPEHNHKDTQHMCTDIHTCMRCMHMDICVASLCMGVGIMPLHPILSKTTRFSTDHSKSVSRTGSRHNQGTKLHYQYAVNCLGTGTPEVEGEGDRMAMERRHQGWRIATEAEWLKLYSSRLVHAGDSKIYMLCALVG